MLFWLFLYREIMVSISGYVEKIVYRNEENGYTVLVLSYEKDELSCVGTFQYINEGEYVGTYGCLYRASFLW
jgi:hypothetical protein